MLGRIRQRWAQLARTLGTFQSRLLLTILYATVILPFGLIAALFSDPLRIENRPARWLEQPNEPRDLSWARKQ
jgi:hypothetical protein